MTTRGRAFVLGSLACVLASSASAQHVVWQPPHGDGALAREVVARLLDRGLDVTLDPTAGLADLGGDVSEQDAMWLALADREVAMAREELAALDEPAALARIDRLLAETLQRPHVPGVVARRVEALLLRAMVAAQRGQPATDDFAEVARLDPERRLAAAEAPPAVREQADDARSAALASSAVLVVDPGVPGAEVFLDDVLLGPAPIRVGPIAAGRHVIRIEAPAHETYAEWLEISAGGRPAFRPALVPVPPLVTWRRGVVALRDGGSAAGGLASWTWLLVRPGRGDRIAVRSCLATLERCSAWTRTTLAEVALPAALPDTWEPASRPTLLDPETSRWVAGPRPFVPGRRPRPSTPWYGRPWVWAVAATVVVGTGVGIGLGAALAEGDTRRVHFVAGGAVDTDERD